MYDAGPPSTVDGPPPPRVRECALIPLLLATLPALAAASFLSPVFSAAGVTERYVSHAASGSSVFLLTLVDTAGNSYFV